MRVGLETVVKELIENVIKDSDYEILRQFVASVVGKRSTQGEISEGPVPSS
jgi:hypothetical protein